MRELVRTNDAVVLSAIEALLKGAEIEFLIVDQNMSVLEGSIGIFPRRILVSEEDWLQGRRLLTDAGLGHELRPDKGGAAIGPEESPHPEAAFNIRR